VDSANAFIEKLKALDAPFNWGLTNGVMDKVKGYGSYDEVYNDPVSAPPNATPVDCPETETVTDMVPRMSMRSISEHHIISTTKMPKALFSAGRTSSARNASLST
jgi:hypothetical protein